MLEQENSKLICLSQITFIIKDQSEMWKSATFHFEMSYSSFREDLTDKHTSLTGLLMWKMCHFADWVTLKGNKNCISWKIKSVLNVCNSYVKVYHSVLIHLILSAGICLYSNSMFTREQTVLQALHASSNIHLQALIFSPMSPGVTVYQLNP